MAGFAPKVDGVVLNAEFMDRLVIIENRFDMMVKNISAEYVQ